MTVCTATSSSEHYQDSKSPKSHSAFLGSETAWRSLSPETKQPSSRSSPSVRVDCAAFRQMEPETAAAVQPSPLASRLRSPSSTRCATPRRTTRRSGRASVATTPSSESCPNSSSSSGPTAVRGEGRGVVWAELGWWREARPYTNLLSCGCERRDGDPELYWME